jgi:hypothetical protein
MNIRDQKEDNELRFTIIILRRMIIRACEDAVAKTKGFKRNNTENVAVKWQEDAIHFLKSKEFEQLCDAVGWSYSFIRRKAFLQDNNKQEVAA